MPSLQGLRFRLGWIRDALTRRFDDLVYQPVADRGVFDFLAPLIPDMPAPPPELLSATAPEVGRQAIIESSEPEVARTLFTVARLLRAVQVVEVGVFRGYTSQFLAAAVGPGGTLHLVDADDAALAEAIERSKPYCGGRIIAHHGFSTDRAVIAAVPGDCDLVFLDADHSEAGVTNELECWLPKLRPGGVLAVHDSIAIGGVCRAVNRAARRCPAFTVATSRGSGLTFFQPSAER